MTDPQEYIGKSIGNYRLLRLIGEGTFGAVYLAEHFDDHTHVAVKLLHSPLSSRDDWHAFLNEARTVRLHHPYIVPILDFGLTRDDLPYLVMAYAGAGTLRDRYPEGSRLSSETIDISVQQLASALQYAHDHHIIHRDVKPENMLVSNDGTVQLSDFGIAKISEHAGLSTMYKVAGTSAYTAPEQSEGKPCPASDQYALAVVVYEWFTGQLPFQGDPLAVTWQHRTDVPPSLRSICPEVSPQVEQVISRALAKALQDRFPTITHFAEALHTALRGVTPARPLPNPVLSRSASMIPVSLSGASSPREGSVGMLVKPDKIEYPSQSVIASPSSVEILNARSLETLQSPRSAPDLQKQFSMDRRLRVIGLLVSHGSLIFRGIK